MMKNYIITILAVIMMLTTGCSKGSILHAPNGKKYYIDIDNCNEYTLNRDTLICHDIHDNEFKKIYMPVTFGYEVDVRDGY